MNATQDEINLRFRDELSTLDAEVKNIKDEIVDLIKEMRGIKNALYLIVIALVTNSGPQLVRLFEAFGAH